MMKKETWEEKYKVENEKGNEKKIKREKGEESKDKNEEKVYKLIYHWFFLIKVKSSLWY